MRLLINYPISYFEKFNPEIDTKDAFDEYFKDREEILKEFTVFFKSDLNDKSYQITIDPQKVNLDEINMNTLFFDVLNDFDNLQLKYSPLGGEGCEFAMKLTQGQN